MGSIEILQGVNMSLEIGKYIDEMMALRSEKRHHEAEVKRIDASIKLMEGTLKLAMIEQGITEAKGVYGKATYDEKVLYPQVDDWNMFHEYIKANNMFDLLHKRISLTNYRQLVEAQVAVPGVVPNYVSEVNLRSI
jgi:hypothetical protein